MSQYLAEICGRLIALAGALALGCAATNASAPVTYYSTTYAGGTNGGGTVYTFTRGRRPERQVIYDFCAHPNCTDGGYPLTNVILLGDGSLIGTTSVGGAGGGTIFRLSPAPNGTWTRTTLFDFCLYFGQCARFGAPNGTLTLLGANKIMGTVSAEDGRGAVWTFRWGDWGEEFSPLEYWGKEGK